MFISSLNFILHRGDFVLPKIMIRTFGVSSLAQFTHHQPQELQKEKLQTRFSLEFLTL